MSSELQAVIFDLDGVITDTAEHHYNAWSRLAQELGAPFSREFNEHLRGLGRMESLDLILKSGNIQLSDQEKASCAERKNGYYTELIQTLSPNDILPGIQSLLEGLKERGIKRAIASASKNSRVVLSRLGLIDHFEAIADGHSTKKSKPDPEVFLHAAASLGIATTNCMGIEDAAAGVQAINAAHMYSVGIGDSAILSAANHCLPSTSLLTVETVVTLFKNR